MGVLDKFLDIMKLSDDEDYDDDFYDDEYDDDFEEKPKKSFFKKNNKGKDFDDEEAEEDFDLPEKSTKPVHSSNKVTPMRQPARRSNVNMEVCVIKPNSVEDAREITETLLANRTVVLNLEGLDVDIAQRIIDFTSGSCFAISGNLQKISNYIFIITPAAVDISGDFLNIVDSFDTTRGL